MSTVFVVEHRERTSDFDSSAVMIVASSLEKARNYCDENRLEELTDGNVVWSWYEIEPLTLDVENVFGEGTEFWGKHGPLDSRPLEGY